MIVKPDATRRAAKRRNGAVLQRRSQLPHRTPRRKLRMLRHDWTTEAAFWARCAEYDDGRLAQEADHVFDTSYPWAF